MKAYLFGFFEINDLEKYHKSYVEPALALIAKYGGKPLIVSDEHVTKEGRLPDGRLVVIEFPDMSAAEAFWHDPEYQPLKPVRQALTRSNLAFAHGFDPPG